MAQNTNSVSSQKPAKSSRWLLNLFCFIAVVCIGISLILSKISWFSKIASALTMIAQILSYSALIIISSFYIVKRRNLWLWILWAVSVVLIVVYFII